MAEQACRIEIDVLGKPIGSQDQYAAAFGGLNYIRFNTDGTVNVEPVPCRAETIAELERWVLSRLHRPDQGRQWDPGAAIERHGESHWRYSARCATWPTQMRDVLGGDGDVEQFAELAASRRGRSSDRSGCGISNERVDAWYAAARRAGAIGGKLLGAGGGGFLLLLAPPWRHRAIREALGRPREVPFRIARHGSRIIFIQP